MLSEGAKRPGWFDASFCLVQWLATELSALGDTYGAKDSLVNGIDCNDGTRLLTKTMVDNAAGAARHRSALVAAADRFRELSTTDEVHTVTALLNLKVVLRWLGKKAPDQETAMKYLGEALELDAKIQATQQKQAARNEL